jgi:hypothetical protein
MIVLSRSKNAASMTFIVSVAGSVPEQGRNAPNAPGPRIRCAQSVEVRRYPRSRRRQGTWWAPRSSKPVCGRELAGGFDSRPPPLLNEASDQPLREEGGKAAEGARSELRRPRLPHKSFGVRFARHRTSLPTALRKTGQSSAAVLSKERSDSVDDLAQREPGPSALLRIGPAQPQRSRRRGSPRAACLVAEELRAALRSGRCRS